MGLPDGYILIVIYIPYDPHYLNWGYCLHSQILVMQMSAKPLQLAACKGYTVFANISGSGILRYTILEVEIFRPTTDSCKCPTKDSKI